jgi:opacity protein-like surface antigen
MRKAIIAIATSVIALSPANARDHSPYAGIEGGVLFARDMDIDLLHFRNENGVDDNSVTDDIYEMDLKTGIDLDLIGGYDFGVVRAEAELGWKKASVDTFIFTEEPQFPQDGEGHVSVLSLMGNVLLDLGNENGLSFYAGPGIGYAWSKLHNAGTDGFNANGKDSAWAWQLIAGVRYAVSANLDLGLKYRYFQTARLRYEDVFDTEGETFNCATIPTANIPCTFSDDFRTKFRSHSLMASIVYNFAAPPPPPPPPPPPVEAPPPPPPAPATQTCPDGSVILASDACPPPPAPPPPPPEPERG